MRVHVHVHVRVRVRASVRACVHVRACTCVLMDVGDTNPPHKFRKSH